MSGALFYISIIGFASGIFFRSFFDMGMPGILMVFLMSLACGVAWRLHRRDQTSALFTVSIFFLLLGIGMFRFEMGELKVSPLSVRVGETALYEGIVVREPEARTTALHLYIRDEATDTLFLALVDPFENITYGDRVTVEGELVLPETFETETGRVFDYVGYLKARGVSEVMYRAHIEVLQNGEGSPVLEKLLIVKHRFMDIIERSIPEPALGLGEGVLLGVKRALGEHLEEVFRTVGIIHIVVLSGYNIMIVADSVMKFLGYIFFPRTRLLFGLLAIILFALMVGLSATVVRASLMAGLVVIARTIGRSYAVLRALSLAGVVMLLINPYLIAFDPGFQLSFLATLGLILLSPELELRMPRIPETLGLRGYLATTLGTQLFVLPLLLFSMGTLSLVSVLANVLILPAVPVAMFVTFLTGVVGSVIPFLGTVIGFGAHLVLSYIINVAEILSTIPFAAVDIPAFSFVFVILMYAGLGVWTWWLMPKTLPANGTIERTIRGEGDSNSKNDYADWVIEEVNEEDLKNKDNTKSPGARNVPGDSFPFR